MEIRDLKIRGITSHSQPYKGFTFEWECNHGFGECVFKFENPKRVIIDDEDLGYDIFEKIVVDDEFMGRDFVQELLKEFLSKCVIESEIKENADNGTSLPG